MAHVAGLVVTRKYRETIVIGDDIVIEVNNIHGRQVSLRVIAPDHVRVDRGEVRDRMIAEGKYVPGGGA